MPTIESERMADDLRNVTTDAEELMKETAAQSGEKLRDIRARLTTAIESARETCRRLEQRTVEAARATDRAIRDHPYESIGLAFGVGLLIGVLVGRR